MTEHPNRPGAKAKDVLQVLERLLELAGQDGPPGTRIEARKIRHRPARFTAWDLAGARTYGQTSPAPWEFRLLRISPDGTAEAPKTDQPAKSWEQALIPWTQALAVGSPENPDLQEAQVMITAMARKAEDQRPKPSRIDQATTWLQRYFGHRTEIPVPSILKAGHTRGFSAMTLTRARRRAGYTCHQRWQTDHSVHLWRRPAKPNDPQDKPE